MRFASLLLGAASLAATVNAYWLGDIARKEHLYPSICDYCLILVSVTDRL